MVLTCKPLSVNYFGAACETRAGCNGFPLSPLPHHHHIHVCPGSCICIAQWRCTFAASASMGALAVRTATAIASVPVHPDGLLLNFVACCCCFPLLTGYFAVLRFIFRQKFFCARRYGPNCDTPSGYCQSSPCANGVCQVSWFPVH